MAGPAPAWATLVGWPRRARGRPRRFQGHYGLRFSFSPPPTLARREAWHAGSAGLSAGQGRVKRWQRLWNVDCGLLRPGKGKECLLAGPRRGRCFPRAGLFRPSRPRESVAARASPPPNASTSCYSVLRHWARLSPQSHTRARAPHRPWGLQGDGKRALRLSVGSRPADRAPRASAAPG